jgi:hypothetical protein
VTVLRSRVYEDCSILALGARGRLVHGLDAVGIVLVGRTCLQGRRGALWSEWTVRADDGRTLFLGESAGTLTLYEPGSVVPSFEDLTAGSLLPAFVVVERGEARRVATWGEAAEGPASYRYVDLSPRARPGESITLDFGAEAHEPLVFVGRRVKPSDLGLEARPDPPRGIAIADVSRPHGVEPWLAPGDEGELDGRRVHVVAALHRCVPGDEATRWDEYAIYDRDAGLRWLVVASGHWSLVTPVDAGLVHDGGETAVLGDETYAALPSQFARTDWGAGELPWEVVIGETMAVRDYSTPASLTLTKEWSADEVTWSRAEPIPPATIARAFEKRLLPRPG